MVGATCRTLGRIRGTMENFFCFFVCFDFVPFVGDPRECRGDVAFLPTFEPPRRQGCANPPPPPPPKGFETHMNSSFTTSIVRPGWGATGNSSRELTWGCYALKHKYHLPSPPPPCCNFFCQHTYHKNVQRDEGVILSHICWGAGAPLPAPDPPQTQPPPPPSP